MVDILNSICENYTQRNQILVYLREKNLHDLKSYMQNNNLVGYDTLCEIMRVSSNPIEGIKELSSILKDEKYKVKLEEMSLIITSICELSHNIVLDLSQIPNIEFYNDIVFCGYVKGNSKVVLTGGRYDKLASKIGIKNKNALGFAVNLSCVKIK